MSCALPLQIRRSTLLLSSLYHIDLSRGLYRTAAEGHVIGLEPRGSAKKLPACSFAFMPVLEAYARLRTGPKHSGCPQRSPSGAKDVLAYLWPRGSRFGLVWQREDSIRQTPGSNPLSASAQPLVVPLRMGVATSRGGRCLIPKDGLPS